MYVVEGCQIVCMWHVSVMYASITCTEGLSKRRGNKEKT